VILISKGHYRIKYNFSTSLKILERTLKQNVDKLHHYLQIQIEIRKQLKNVHGSRVSTYLNIPGNTEEDFMF